MTASHPTPLPHPITGDLFDSPVPPGTGWPGDPATSNTPVCHTAEDIAARADQARSHGDLTELEAAISVCSVCDRLVDWRQSLAVHKRAAFADQPYWSRPVPSFGNPDARRVIVGLAPSAHGSNRTGRNFTGDPAGRWLYRALYKAGACTREESIAAGDGMEITAARVVPPVHCAPPHNKPTTEEKATCRTWFSTELSMIRPVAILALGQIGWTSVFQAGAALGWEGISPRPKFGHNVTATVTTGWGPLTVVGCYHPSQRNTSTKLLTEPKLDAAMRTFLAIAIGGEHEEHDED